MTRFLTAATVALTIGMATVPAFAITQDASMAKDLTEAVEKATKDVAPDFVCYDPTNKETCQTFRGVKSDGGYFNVSTFASKITISCGQPDGVNYRLCTAANTDAVWGEIKANDRFIEAPENDDRCKAFGDNLSQEYLACEAALPIKS